MSRSDILDMYPEDEFMFADGWDEAIIGVDNNMRVVYDANKIIGMLSEEMSYSEALEYFYFNIEGSYVGSKTPIYVSTIIP